MNQLLNQVGHAHDSDRKQLREDNYLLSVGLMSKS